jgi:hypothetical protein
MTKPKAASERSRLALQEDGWLLPGAVVSGCATAPAAAGIVSRTRGGNRRTTTADEQDVAEQESSEEDEDLEEEEEEEEAVEETEKKATKPPNTRVLLEVKQLESVFENIGCPRCGSPVALSLRTLCIATSIGIECTDKEACKWFLHPQQPVATTIHDDNDDSYERSTDYAINVLYILGFISMGDGPTEAGRLLGLLGLPNDTTMVSRSFGIVEERITPFIKELCDEIIHGNIVAEAKLSMEASPTQDHLDYNNWTQSLSDPTMVIPAGKMPKIDASYDMAWQQKGSGHQYNSQSGHGTLMGHLTRKVVGLCIKSKICNQCNVWEKNNPGEPMPLHTCWKNHDGSSGSMESAACLELVVETFRKKNCVVRWLCCDDDSSIRADCQWSNADYLINNNTDVLPMVAKKMGINKGKLQVRPDKGKLPADVPEPLFVADPNHRRKGITGELIKLDMAKVDIKNTMTRMDSTRIGKNFGYMARTLKGIPEDQYEDKAQAVLEHHFDNHEYCGDWCKRKNETPQQRKTAGKYYRCKTRDAKLYAVLQEKMSRFVTKDKLIEMAHGLDTNMNEAFNQICTWFAPKNKVYAGAYSLQNRIAFAVGINSVGVLEFFTRLFRKLGITMTDNVEHYLKTKENTRMKKLAKVKTSSAKKQKNKRKYEKLAENVKIAKMELHKRLGTYRRGMNLDDPIDDEVAKQSSRKKQKTFCEHCGSSDHATKRSKKCTAQQSAKRYSKYDGTLLSATTLPVQDPEDEDPMIALPLSDVDDCHDFDHEPLIHLPGEDGFDLDAFLNEGPSSIGQAGREDDSPVAAGVVRANL